MPFHYSFHEDLTYFMKVSLYDGLILWRSHFRMVLFNEDLVQGWSFYEGLILQWSNFFKFNYYFYFFMQVLFYGGLILRLWYPAALSVNRGFSQGPGNNLSISIAQVRTEPFQRFSTLKIVRWYSSYIIKPVMPNRQNSTINKIDCNR